MEGKNQQPLTRDQTIKEGYGAVTPNDEEKSLNLGTEPPMAQEKDLQCVKKRKGRPKKRKVENLKKTLNYILSMVASPDALPKDVKTTPLGENVTYQEAILISQVLKAINGDTRAAVFLRDILGNKHKDSDQEEPTQLTWEDIILNS